MTSSKASQGGGRRGKSTKNDSLTSPGTGSNDLTAQLLTALSDSRIVDALQKALLPGIKLLYDEEWATMKMQMQELTSQVEHLKAENVVLRESIGESRSTSTNPPSTTRQSNNEGAHDVRSTLVSVHKELEDKRKRSSNVIVHGLAEVEGVADDVAFASFMESHLVVKPSFHRDRCKRLGQKVHGRIQPLLVTFNSTIAAADVLACSSSLRSTAPTVFINPDLTRAEAQLAYEERCKYRDRKNKNRPQNPQPPSATGNQPEIMNCNVPNPPTTRSGRKLNVDADPFNCQFSL